MTLGLQVVVLFGEAFHDCGLSLNLSFEGGGTWFVSLVVGGSHRASEYHTALCSGSGSTVLLRCSHRRRQLMMLKIISKSLSHHVLQMKPA